MGDSFLAQLSDPVIMKEELIDNIDSDVISELLHSSPPTLPNIQFDVDNFLYMDNCYSFHPMLVKEEIPLFTAYSQKTDLDSSFSSPLSPSESFISTDNFPEELDELEESGMESAGESIIELSLPVINIDHSEDMEVIEEDVSEDSDSNHLRPLTRNLQRQGSRVRRRPRRLSPDSTDSESDPDYDPEEFEEIPTKKKISTKSIKKEQTSDYESEEFDCEKPLKRQPSKHPVPQQRKKGSKLKISQWIVSLLRNPETNPSVITWENEPTGKFRVTDSAKYAELWGIVKRNPKMNYEKLSRAMRYYYKNKEISMVQGERLTYQFGPNMRDFHARDRADPNFKCLHTSNA